MKSLNLSIAALTLAAAPLLGMVRSAGAKPLAEMGWRFAQAG